MTPRLSPILPVIALCMSAVVAYTHEGVVQIALPATADTTLFQTTPGNNLGGSDTLIVGANARGDRNRALVRFDLRGPVPTNAAVLAVSVSFNVVNANSNAPPVTLALHRLLRSWSEGTKTGNNGAPAGAGESTWNHRSTPDQAWSQPGAAARDDFAATASASVEVTSLGEIVFSGSTQLALDVQHWIEHPEENFGWLLVSDAEAVPQSTRRLASRENTNHPPALHLEYKVPEDEVRIVEFGIGGKFFLLHLDLEPGREHVVQFKTSLTEEHWTDLKHFPASPVFSHFVVADELEGNTRRFYRLKVTEQHDHDGTDHGHP